MILRNKALSILLRLGIVIVLAGCDLERGMGELVDEQAFEALHEYDHEWFANLQPGKKYQITVKATEIANTEILAALSVNKNKAMLCETCDLGVSGYLNQNDLVVTFISPPDGRVKIVLYVTGADVASSINVSQIDP
jgi:hypothetical protein